MRVPDERATAASERYEWLLDRLRADGLTEEGMEAAFSAPFLSQLPPSDLLAWLHDVTRTLTSSARTVEPTEFGIRVTYAVAVVMVSVEEFPPHRFTGLALRARDWVSWHRDYDNPDSGLSRRLRTVQHHVAQFLDAMPEGGARVISACAGEGRDILGVLPDHPRRGDARVRLVELDPQNASRARSVVEAAGLTSVEVVEGDAGTTDSYTGAVPADLLLVCGVFGNISLADIENTIRCLRSLSAPSATVIWTRHPRQPGVIDQICRWFADEEYDLLDLDVPDDHAYGVGVHRLSGAPVPPQPGRRLFSFTV